MQNNKRVMNLEEKIIGDITGEFKSTTLIFSSRSLLPI